MTVLFLVVPLAIVASLIAVVAFAWSVDSGQFDDLETPALRMLEETAVGEGDRARGARPSGVTPPSHDARSGR